MAYVRTVFAVYDPTWLTIIDSLQACRADLRSRLVNAEVAHSYEAACQAFAVAVPGLCRDLTFCRGLL